MSFAIPALTSMHYPAGVLIGLAAAAPVGPINLLVIQRALCQNVAAALVLGFGGAMGDALFAAIAGFGIAVVSTALHEHVEAIRFFGGAIMLMFAVLIWRASPHMADNGERLPALRMAAVTFGMTMTNPATLFFFVGSFGAAGFSGIGHDTPEHRWHSALLVAGVFSGSMLWWVVISSVARAFRGRVADRHLARLNHITAAALAVFGIGAIGAGLMAA